MDPPAHAALPRAGEVHRALYDFVAACHRRRDLPTTFHLGLPSGRHVAVTDQDAFDAALRVDIVERALACTGDRDAFAWLTRPGDLGPGRRDHQWYGAACAAYATHGLPPPDFYLVTRRGWLDLSSGEVHTWYRVRPGRLTDGPS